METENAPMLPLEILYLVFKYLDPKDLSTVGLVSKHFHQVNVDSLWRQHCKLKWKNKLNFDFKLFYRANFQLCANDLSIKELKSILQDRRINFAHLIEKKEFCQEVMNSNPRNAVAYSSKWKSSYIAAEKDAKRDRLEKHELCTKRWVFRFKQWPREQPGMLAKFNEDYTYKSHLIDGDMRWRFYAGDVQVEQYPPLRPTRCEDWGWRLDNEYVVFFELDN